MCDYLHLELLDEVDDLGRSDPGLAASDGAGKDRARLVVPGKARRERWRGHITISPPPGQYLGDASARDPELPGDVAGSDPQLGQLDDPHAHVIGQGAPVHEEAAELIHLAVLVQLGVCRRRNKRERRVY